MELLQWITPSLSFQKVFMVIYQVLTSWLTMSLSINQKFQKSQSSEIYLASYLGNPWVEAIALKVQQMQPNAWNDAVRVAPICKVYFWKCFSSLADASGL